MKFLDTLKTPFMEFFGGNSLSKCWSPMDSKKKSDKKIYIWPNYDFSKILLLWTLKTHFLFHIKNLFHPISDFHSAQRCWSESRSGLSICPFVCSSVRPSICYRPPSYLNGGSYDQNEENSPFLTFWVDSKKYFENFKNKLKNPKKDPPKIPKT